LPDPPKFTQIGIFGLKTNHLATLCPMLILSGNGKKAIRHLISGQDSAFQYPMSQNNFALCSQA
jgi:hypothetical protein